MVNKRLIREEIQDIFINSQITAATHQKNCILLKKIYEDCQFDEFFSAFQSFINVILITDFKQRNVYVEKIIEFIASFCLLLKSSDQKNRSQSINEDEDDCEEHPLLDKLFFYLLEASQNKEDVVRFRSCQLINKLLDKLAGTAISNSLCEDLTEVLMLRLSDSKNVIRLQSIISLFRLQDPSDVDDQITKNFITLMSSDPNSKIRQLALEKISITKKVIPHMVLRTRDTEPNVRLAAYKRLSLIPKALKIVEKQEILKCAMIYAAPKVTDYVSTTFLSCWLKQYDDNILALIKSLRLDASEIDIEDTSKIVEFVLVNIFKTKTFKELLEIVPFDDKKLILLENLNWESVMYWRVFVDFLSQHSQLEDNLDQVLPEIYDFCNYIKLLITSTSSGLTSQEFLEQQFIFQNLFAIIKNYEFDDPSRKRIINSLITHTLINSDPIHSTIKEMIDTLVLTIPHNIEQRCNFVGELISEILCPLNVEEATKIEMEKECELAKLRVKLETLKTDLEKAVAENKFLEADSLQKELDAVHAANFTLKNAPMAEQQPVTQKTDLPTLSKCLGIARALLLSPKITELYPSLHALQRDFIEDLVGHKNDTVKALAMECYALCCIVDKNSAEIGIQIFSIPILAYKAGEECDTKTLIICANAIVDFLRIFGTDLIAEPNENSLSETRHEGHIEIFTGGTSLTNLIQGLMDLMDDEQYELQEVSGQGLCKLVISNRIYSAPLISKLILKWGSPCSDDLERDKLKQFIGFALQKIPLLSDSSDQLEDAIILTLNAIIKAPRTSPLADINIDNISKFMVALCKISPDEHQISKNIALKVCLKMRSKPRSILNTAYSKLLLLLDMPYDKVAVRELLKLCDQIKDDVRERAVNTNITKFVANLTMKKLQCDPDAITVIKEEDEEHPLQETSSSIKVEVEESIKLGIQETTSSKEVEVQETSSLIQVGVQETSSPEVSKDNTRSNTKSSKTPRKKRRVSVSSTSDDDSDEFVESVGEEEVSIETLEEDDSSDN